MKFIIGFLLIIICLQAQESFLLLYSSDTTSSTSNGGGTGFFDPTSPYLVWSTLDGEGHFSGYTWYDSSDTYIYSTTIGNNPAVTDTGVYMPSGDNYTNNVAVPPFGYSTISYYYAIVAIAFVPSSFVSLSLVVSRENSGADARDYVIRQTTDGNPYLGWSVAGSIIESDDTLSFSFGSWHVYAWIPKYNGVGNQVLVPYVDKIDVSNSSDWDLDAVGATVYSESTNPTFFKVGTADAGDYGVIKEFRIYNITPEEESTYISEQDYFQLVDHLKHKYGL